MIAGVLIKHGATSCQEQSTSIEPDSWKLFTQTMEAIKSKYSARFMETIETDY